MGSAIGIFGGALGIMGGQQAAQAQGQAQQQQGQFHQNNLIGMQQQLQHQQNQMAQAQQQMMSQGKWWAQQQGIMSGLWGSPRDWKNASYKEEEMRMAIGEECSGKEEWHILSSIDPSTSEQVFSGKIVEVVDTKVYVMVGPGSKKLVVNCWEIEKVPFIDKLREKGLYKLVNE